MISGKVTARHVPMSLARDRLAGESPTLTMTSREASGCPIIQLLKSRYYQINRKGFSRDSLTLNMLPQ